jgi:hypothetical protein
MFDEGENSSINTVVFLPRIVLIIDLVNRNK